MPDDTENLLNRMIAGDHDAVAEIVARAATFATTTRDRQLVAVAAAHLAGDEDLFLALVRDHLADYPDNRLAAWIAAKHTQPVRPAPFSI